MALSRTHAPPKKNVTLLHDGPDLSACLAAAFAGTSAPPWSRSFGRSLLRSTGGGGQGDRRDRGGRRPEGLRAVSDMKHGCGELHRGITRVQAREIVTP